MNALRPERYCRSVLDLDPGRLVQAGLRGVLLDLDNTLLPRGQQRVSPEVAGWVARLEQAGLGVCIVSNTAKPRVRAVAEDLGVAVVENARKPLRSGYLHACALLGIEPEQAVMVGDQSYTDILGAHRVGMQGILVVPNSAHDLLHTRILRLVDAYAVRGMEPERCDGQES